MLTLTKLEPRNNPSPLIPGWDGEEQITYGNFDADGFPDRAVVALEGGSAHVMIFGNPHGDGQPFDVAREWPVIHNEIVFDPEFRGGGFLKVIPGAVTDSLLIVPGAGGGPVVAQITFENGPLSHTFFAPFGVDYRGGLWASTGDVDRDGIPEALFINRVGPSRLIAVDMRTFETEASIYVGEDARFEPTGGMLDGDFLIQYGEIVNNHAPTKRFKV